MSTELKVYRRSELESISNGCLFRHKAIWVDGTDDTSDLALIGIGGHAVSHAYIMALVKAGVSQDAELADAAFIEGIANAQTPARLIPEIKHVWQFFAERFELPLDRFVAAEEHQTSGEIGWTPDLVLANPQANELEVHDFKWGWAPPPTDDALKMLFQARVYSRYAMAKWPGFFSYRFTLHAVRFGKMVSVQFTQNDLDSVDVELAAAIATIQKAERDDEWPAVAGPSCHFCELACPIADQQITLPKRLTVAQYRDLGAWLLVADKQLRSAKKLMKATVNVYGPCDVNGVVWDNRPSVSRSYPAQEVVTALAKVTKVGGLEPAEAQALTFSHSALKGVFKAFPRIEADLLPLATERTSWRFSAKKAGELDEGEEE